MSKKDLLTLAAEIVRTVKLPPNADPLWVERLKVAEELVDSVDCLTHLKQIHARTFDEPARTNVQNMIDEGTAVCEQLHDRLQQIVAAVDAPDRVQ